MGPRREGRVRKREEGCISLRVISGLAWIDMISNDDDRIRMEILRELKDRVDSRVYR